MRDSNVPCNTNERSKVISNTWKVLGYQVIPVRGTKVPSNTREVLGYLLIPMRVAGVPSYTYYIGIVFRA